MSRFERLLHRNDESYLPAPRKRGTVTPTVVRDELLGGTTLYAHINENGRIVKMEIVAGLAETANVEVAADPIQPFSPYEQIGNEQI
jgi:hypothetical protein